jgi:hypothetical protein
MLQLQTPQLWLLSSKRYPSYDSSARGAHYHFICPWIGLTHGLPHRQTGGYLMRYWWTYNYCSSEHLHVRNLLTRMTEEEDNRAERRLLLSKNLSAIIRTSWQANHEPNSPLMSLHHKLFRDFQFRVHIGTTCGWARRRRLILLRVIRESRVSAEQLKLIVQQRLFLKWEWDFWGEQRFWDKATTTEPNKCAFFFSGRRFFFQPINDCGKDTSWSCGKSPPYL